MMRPASEMSRVSTGTPACEAYAWITGRNECVARAGGLVCVGVDDGRVSHRVLRSTSVTLLDIKISRDRGLGSTGVLAGKSAVRHLARDPAADHVHDVHLFGPGQLAALRDAAAPALQTAPAAGRGGVLGHEDRMTAVAGCLPAVLVRAPAGASRRAIRSYACRRTVAGPRQLPAVPGPARADGTLARNGCRRARRRAAGRAHDRGGVPRVSRGGEDVCSASSVARARPGRPVRAPGHPAPGLPPGPWRQASSSSPFRQTRSRTAGRTRGRAP